MNQTPPPSTTQSFAKSAIPLSLTVKPSKLYLTAVVVFHLLALYACASAAISATIQVAIAVLVIVSLVYNLAVSVKTRRITWHTENRWTLERVRKQTTDQPALTEATLTSVDFLSRWLVILSLKPQGGRSKRVVIPFDSVAKDRYRLLRVRLRVDAHRLLNPSEPTL